VSEVLNPFNDAADHAALRLAAQNQGKAGDP
jgi:hypothetical protein